MLAGEEFSDRPRCVCPVIGAFLRAWNDRAAYRDRQRLRPYSAKVVGSRASSKLTRQRRDLCLEWAGADLGHGPIRRLVARSAMRVRIAASVGVREALRLEEGAPEYAARRLLGCRDLPGAYLLLDAMLAIGGDVDPPEAKGEAVVEGPAPFPLSSAFGPELTGLPAPTDTAARVGGH